MCLFWTATARLRSGMASPRCRDSTCSVSASSAPGAPTSSTVSVRTLSCLHSICLHVGLAADRTESNMYHQLSDDFDVVVVGARMAGAATAMLLARRGIRVALV